MVPVVVALGVSNACSSSSGSETQDDAGSTTGSGGHGSSTPGHPLPASALAVPSSFQVPTAVPTACEGSVYYESPASVLCPMGDTYFVCVGTVYADYDCDNPGSGWTLETTSPDPTGSSSGSSSSTGSVALPEGALAVPSSFEMPSEIPPDCEGTVYYEYGSTTLCPATNTYFLCESGHYEDYDCAAPGEGWSLETSVPDPMASNASSTGTIASDGSCTTTLGSSGSSETVCP